MTARVPFWLQLRWMLFKNFRLKSRNWSTTLKELAFPIYTFALIAILKAVVSLDYEDPIQVWTARPIIPLDSTRAGLSCAALSGRRGASRGGSNASLQASGGMMGNDGRIDSNPSTESSIFSGFWGVSAWGLFSLGSRRGVSVVAQSPCKLLLSPAADETVISIRSAMARRLAGEDIEVLALDNMTAAKRYHLEHPGHVIASIHMSLRGDCASGGSNSTSDRSPLDIPSAQLGGNGHGQAPVLTDGQTAGQSSALGCHIRYDLGVNNTRLLEVRAGLYPQAEEDAGFLAVQQLMYDSILDVVPVAMSDAKGEIPPGPDAARVQLFVKPFPSPSSGISLASAKAKISLVTSLYFVAAWIPSVQVRARTHVCVRARVC